MKKFLHLDIDAFFASVEQLDRPELRGKPVIVGGTGNRGVVATCSYEARAYGVRSAMPAALARRKCPQGIFLPVRYERYREKSAEIAAIYRGYTDLYETVGLDEAYLDLSHYDNAVPIAREIKRRIREETGLTCSIGLSYNMSMAKIASDLKKPDAFVVIRPEEALEILCPLPIGALHGIGRKSQELLAKRGIHTVGDFWALSRDEVIRLFGKFGDALYRRARGEDDREIVMDRPIKSLSRETTLPYDLYERESIASVAHALLDEVWQDVEQEGVQPQTLTLKIKYADFTLRTRQRKAAAGAVWKELLEELLDAFDYKPGVRLVGVGFSNFLPDGAAGERYEQLSLFTLLGEEGGR
ncbi:DNA polymerase IV [Brevibacillus sp. SYP-B805]|uniref:DNA polymerase IV n=1 Tax=Brevibacillus sp. SYP-B805 TaxID=1578199 RepID=UPI0013E9CEF9|nr:DNA polymerase IV [Brevibacillus sp. SYP-B805]NGQ94184.1 DNA polymerase IV [Brevibacillus sp. SYP-B805]